MKHIFSFSFFGALILSCSTVFAGSHQNHSGARPARSSTNVTASSVAPAQRSFAANSNAQRFHNQQLIARSQFATRSQSFGRNRLSTRQQFVNRTGSNQFATRNSQWRRHHHHHDNDRVVFVGSFGYPYYPFGYSYYNSYPYSYYDSSDYYPYSYDDNSYSDAQSNYDDGSYRSGGRRGGSIVIEVQQRLAREGFYKGAIDGVMGSRTHYAIRAYERSHGLTPDGEIDDQLLGTMGLR